MLKIKKLCVTINEKEIIQNLNFSINDGEMHVLMGPNGSGKTTLTHAIAGHPKYKTSGKIILNNENVANLAPDERAKKGIFVAFQNPVSVEGLGLINFIRKAKNACDKTNCDIIKFNDEIRAIAKSVKMDETFLARDLNTGLSGGEKKKSEIVQMLALRPKFIILDEIDSGVDVDSLKMIINAIKSARNRNTMILIITHYANILKYIKPDFVHVMIAGNIIKSGKAKFAKEIEKKGYEWLKDYVRC
ncbi:MAG: Fe-S cluster assembly ATPase SufC [Candidatus Micrarchaeota archaeon]